MTRWQSLTTHDPRPTIYGRRGAAGVTLIEMIVVITITAIVAAVVAVFIRRPVEGYVDAARRAELTDIADTALRRFTRDVRTALPNSIRVDGTGKFLEYLQTSGGGRYRAEKDSGGGGIPLDFTGSITQFDVIGTMPTLAAGDSIVIYNLSGDTALTVANAYEGDNRSAYSSSTPPTITISSKQFPFASPGKRFQVLQHPVTYHCDLGTGVLRRYWGYTIQRDPQPVPPTVPPGSSALLATNVTDCNFTYSTSGVSGRTGVVSLTLQIEQSNEKVKLFQQVHVINVP